MSPSETARVISRLAADDQRLLFGLLSPEDAADVMEDIPEAQAVDLVEDLPTAQAAAILEELPSDHRIDVLGARDQGASRAVLETMGKEGADEARMFLEYAPNCAGGLMVSEFLAYRTDDTIQDVLDDLQANRGDYADYHVQYFYVLDHDDKLIGVLRMHDLLFPPRETNLSQILLPSPLCISHESSLKELEQFVDEHHFFGVPVVDDEQRMVGVILSHDVEEARGKRKTRTFLRLSGVIGGEEFRTMPLLSRSELRLSWISINIVLNRLIRRMADEDGWGAPRIHGELHKLGFVVSETTVSRHIPRKPADPDQVQRWMTFLRNHKDGIAAMDFFVVPTISLRVLCGFFVSEHGRRRSILHRLLSATRPTKRSSPSSL